MEQVLHYLEMKNQYFEKFYQLTVKLLNQVNQDKWDEIDQFVDNRDRILNIIRSFDHKIAKRTQELKLDEDQMRHYRSQVKALITLRQEIAERIFAVDLELIGRIDEIKSETIRELKHTLETTSQISAFSPPAKKTPKARNEA